MYISGTAHSSLILLSVFYQILDYVSNFVEVRYEFQMFDEFLLKN